MADLEVHDAIREQWWRWDETEEWPYCIRHDERLVQFDEAGSGVLAWCESCNRASSLLRDALESVAQPKEPE